MKMESVLLAFWFSVTGLRLASLLTRRRSLAYAVGTLVVFVLPCLAVSLFIDATQWSVRLVDTSCWYIPSWEVSLRLLGYGT
jgi:hypothetical protein